MIIYRYNSELLINKSGVKKIMTLINIDGSETPVFALEKLSTGNRVVGYTDLKPYSSEKYNILSIEACVTDFNVFKKRDRLFHKTEGYIPVGTDGNEFIGVIKPRILLSLLPIFLLIILSVFLYFGLNPDAKPEWFPTIDSNIGVHQKVEAETNVGSIQVNGFSKWIVPANQTENISVPLTNPKENRCYFQFTITLDETGEVLYESQLVPPGEGIYLININRPLEAGSYAATIHISTTDVETGGKMNSCKLNTTIICMQIGDNSRYESA